MPERIQEKMKEKTTTIKEMMPLEAVKGEETLLKMQPRH